MKSKVIRFRLNAFDKDSSASYSESIEANTLKTFQKAVKTFEAIVPFSRFYTEHEVTDGDVTQGEKWIATVED